jgi:hypothetical protein
VFHSLQCDLREQQARCGSTDETEERKINRILLYDCQIIWSTDAQLALWVGENCSCLQLSFCSPCAKKEKKKKEKEKKKKRKKKIAAGF